MTTRRLIMALGLLFGLGACQQDPIADLQDAAPEIAGSAALVTDPLVAELCRLNTRFPVAHDAWYAKASDAEKQALDQKLDQDPDADFPFYSHAQLAADYETAVKLWDQIKVKYPQFAQLPPEAQDEILQPVYSKIGS